VLILVLNQTIGEEIGREFTQDGNAINGNLSRKNDITI
jgi:hypothetical protein